MGCVCVALSGIQISVRHSLEVCLEIHPGISAFEIILNKRNKQTNKSNVTLMFLLFCATFPPLAAV